MDMDRGDYMETKNRLYRADRPDRFKTFLRRLGRSGRSGRSSGNQALLLLVMRIALGLRMW